MKSFLIKLALIFSLVFLNTAYANATTLTQLSNSVQTFTENDASFEVLTGGSLEVDTIVGVAALSNNGFSNSTILVNTTSVNEGIIDTGSGGAISFVGASPSAINITSGTVSSASGNGTLVITDVQNVVSQIIIGANSGGTATLSNSAEGGSAINIYGVFVNSLTINNKATGTISSQGDAIKLDDRTRTSSLSSLNNAGTITSGSGYEAIELDGYGANITNSGTINGKIQAQYEYLSISQNGGAINGDITMGSGIGSVVNISGGEITGNILMDSETQSVNFGGGVLNGNVNGRGVVAVTNATVLKGSLGNISEVGGVNISNGAALTFNSDSYSINTEKVSIGDGASITGNFSQLIVSEFDSSTASAGGVLNIKIGDNEYNTINALLGSSNGLAALNISGNLTDDSKSATVDLAANIKAATSTFRGIGSAFNLGATKTITGNVVIGDRARLQLDDSASVSGTIKGEEQYKGSLVFRNINLDPNAVSSVTLNGDIGGGGKDLFFVRADYNTAIDASAVAINAQSVELSSLARLTLGGDSVVGDIKGFNLLGSGNGFGDVVFSADNTLGGDVGTSTGNAINSAEISADVDVITGSNQINATSISIGARASLTTADLISGGGSIGDDFEVIYENSAISLGSSSSLILAEGAVLYGSINGSLNGSPAGNGSVEITTTLNSSNSRINIGNTAQVDSVSISDSITFDVSGNNGAVKANSIILGDGAVLKLGNGEIVGSVVGSASNRGTLNIQGNATLSGEIGGGNLSINLLNIGVVDVTGYSVSASESITATNITLNGSLTSLSIASDKTIAGDVTMSNNAKLSVGNSSVVSGEIKGAAQNQGVLEVRNGATFSATSDIGGGGFDLDQIVIYGNLNLSDGNSVAANGQIISLFDGGTLTIGSKAVTGAIRGYGAEYAATNGAGKGTVIFVENNDNFSGSIGTNNGYAIHELEIAESVAVSNSASINAARITVNNNSSLTTSADLISGGNDGDNVGSINTAVTLDTDASLTLNGVDTFLGTIDGVDDGYGTLTLTGNYHGDNSTISIGATKKLAAIIISADSTLNVSHNNRAVKANDIILNDNAVLTVGEATIVGKIDGDNSEQGTFNIYGDTTLNGLIPKSTFTYTTKQSKI